MTTAVTAASGKLGREIIHVLRRTAPEQTIVGPARAVANASDLGEAPIQQHRNVLAAVAAAGVSP